MIRVRIMTIAQRVMLLAQLGLLCSMAIAGFSESSTPLKPRVIGMGGPYCHSEYGSPSANDCMFAIYKLQQEIHGIDIRYAFDQTFGERGAPQIDKNYQLPRNFRFGTCVLEVSINLYEHYTEVSSWVSIIEAFRTIVKQCVRRSVVQTGGLFKTGQSMGLICRVRGRNPAIDSPTASTTAETSAQDQAPVQDCDWGAIFDHNDFTEPEIAACASAERLSQADNPSGNAISPADSNASNTEDLADARSSCPLAFCLVNEETQQCCPGYLCGSIRMRGLSLVLGVLEGAFITIVGTCKPTAARRSLLGIPRASPSAVGEVNALEKRSGPTTECEPYYGSPDPEACRSAVLLMTSQAWTRSDWAEWQAFGHPISPDIPEDLHLPRSYQVGNCAFSIHINLYEGEKDHVSFKEMVNSGQSLIRRCVKSVMFKSGGFDRIGTLGRIVVKIHWAPPVSKRTVLIAHTMMTKSDKNVNEGDPFDCMTWLDNSENEEGSQPSCSTHYSAPGSDQYQLLADIADVPGSPDSRTQDLQHAAETCPSNFCLPTKSDCCPGYDCVDQKIQNNGLMLGILGSFSSFTVGSCVGNAAI